MNAYIFLVFLYSVSVNALFGPQVNLTLDDGNIASVYANDNWGLAVTYNSSGNIGVNIWYFDASTFEKTSSIPIDKYQLFVTYGMTSIVPIDDKRALIFFGKAELNPPNYTYIYEVTVSTDSFEITRKYILPTPPEVITTLGATQTLDSSGNLYFTFNNSFWQFNVDSFDAQVWQTPIPHWEWATWPQQWSVLNDTTAIGTYSIFVTLGVTIVYVCQFEDGKIRDKAQVLPEREGVPVVVYVIPGTTMGVVAQYNGMSPSGGNAYQQIQLWDFTKLNESQSLSSPTYLNSVLDVVEIVQATSKYIFVSGTYSWDIEGSNEYQLFQFKYDSTDISKGLNLTETRFNIISPFYATEQYVYFVDYTSESQITRVEYS
uniref:Predicted protein n=1 Tax=Hordeum vulgare subsp. vulgare TaxID=112509 RepID=F2DFQ5_HORVV|nr:predicted protein [Hordeum vulgare subsp. vulgare]